MKSAGGKIYWFLSIGGKLTSLLLSNIVSLVSTPQGWRANFQTGNYETSACVQSKTVFIIPRYENSDRRKFTILGSIPANEMFK